MKARALIAAGTLIVGVIPGAAAAAAAEPDSTRAAAPGDPTAAQPVLLNQSGFGLGEPKRFTAPRAEDGAAFEITDASGEVRYRGRVHGGVGDFTAFDPRDTGDFVVTVEGAAGVGTSVPFGIGAYWIDRVSYQRAIEFMSGSRCYFGDFTRFADGPGLASDEYGHRECMKAVTWRDGAHYSREIQTLVDLYFVNPSAFEQVSVDDAIYEGLPVTLPDDTPEIVRLIHWGVELLLAADVNEPQLKEQLAAFVHAYPQLAAYIPADVYERARDHVFATWGDPAGDRYYWQAFTPHTGDLFQTYTQVGTGKGELPPGHSVWPNVMMYEVALREGRDDAERYLNAARDQAAWLVGNLDLDDPAVTKGQRQSEYVLITGLVQFAEAYPDQAPEGIEGFVRDWARVATERSDNLWDFRRYSDERWTIPAFTGGGADDPNETGNVAGFAAPALAAARLLGDDDPLADRLREIAAAHVDNLFGRNPTGRHASYDAPSEQDGFEGVERGWFSEYQGGAGLLENLPGVLDGSPKNGHYPFNPGTGNIGHTEGWVAFNAAWNESLVWRAVDQTRLDVLNRRGDPVRVVPRRGEVTVELAAPLNLDAESLDQGTVEVRVGDRAAEALTVTQTGPNTTTFRGTLDLATLGARHGDEVTVSYGYGSFAVSHSFTVVGR
ncbi:hypothetical protein [Streptomyces radicis]|uniref:Alpha-L-rhamnosidase six-hairpin glycosidase domain-containing protein n=1 Tax=Streptomyces radicis TaxID=1750517 RepID=A0A3A9WMJ6_9ACTN|nr:hypothetical protein [Streptomyces radicis]RKN07387.1 hypothetical protein D7319_18720 [Streptomyces radicis]RKN19594.1 hypothetical protein D7318_19805 [Streptomyces radicis]